MLPRLGGYSAEVVEAMRLDQIERRARHVMDVNARLTRK